MEIAALASALGLSGTAVAQTTYGTTGTDDRGTVSSYGAESPSSGAIVTPEDKAFGMGKDDEEARNQNGDEDTSSDNASNDDEMDVDPEASTDQDLNVDRGHADAADTDEASPSYVPPAAPDSLTDGDNASVPPRTGSDVQPGDMGPGNVRGQ
ncbi:MAG TPA: hypothetical protein VJ891_19500 [Casimicrobiaceae bacterium]|nr:hypothetical protein [Casimicrobiaceae bacterium]